MGMPRGGAPHQPQQPEGREHLAEYTVEQLSEVLTPEEIEAANRYQLETPINSLLDNPLPLELRQANELGALMLIGNTIDYDSVTDGLEDAIYEDEKLQAILRLPNEGKRGELLRARRSIVGYLLLKRSVSRHEVA